MAQASVTWRLEVWDRTHTARQAVFQEVLTLERQRVLAGEEALTAQVDPADPAADVLARGSVLRVQEVGASTFSLWRYTGSTRARSNDGALTLQLEADALWMDFRHGMLRSVQDDGRTLTTFGLSGLTPTEWLQEYLIPGYDGDAIAFAVGTVEITDPVDLDFEEDSPMDGLRLLEAELDAESQAEVQFRLNAGGDTYLVDILTRVGKTTGGAEVRYRKNLRGIQKEEDEAEAVSRLYARGADGLTLADARWALAGVAGNVLTFDGEHPVFEDDAFVGLYFHSGGTAYQITDSNAAAGSITVADATGLSAGDEGWLAVDTQGTRLTYLQSPSAYTALGVRVGLHETDIPNVANLLYNGDFTEWSGGLPVGWSVVGSPTVAELADPVAGRSGGIVAHVTAAEGEGLLSAAIDVAQDTALPYHSILAGLTLVSGQVRMELRHSNGRSYPLEEQAKTTSANAYTTLRSYPVSADPLPTGTAQLAIVAHDGAAELHLDAALVSRSIGSVEPSFLVGSGAHGLWWETANELARSGRPKVEYRIDVADLFRVDPDTYPFDELGLGDDVKVRDPAIGQETLRVVEITEDLVNAAVTRLSVAADAWGRPNNPYRHRQRRRRTTPPSPPNAPLGVALADSSWRFYERLTSAYSIAPGGGGDTGPLPGATTLKTTVTTGLKTNAVRVEISGGAISGTYTEDHQVTPGSAWEEDHWYSTVLGDDPVVVDKAWPRDGTVYDVTLTPYGQWSGSAATGRAGEPVQMRAIAPGGIDEPYSDAHPATKYYVDQAAGAGGGVEADTPLNLEGADGNTYIEYNSTAGRIEVYLNGILIMTVESDGIHAKGGGFADL